MKIYILGSVPKGDKIRETWDDWKPAYVKALSALPGAQIVDGDVWQDEARPFTVVGHDAYIIKSSDVIVVNAENKIGAGTAMEMLIAKYFSKPLVSVLPRDTHHRRSDIQFEGKIIEDWVHPFIFTVSDKIAASLEEAVAWVEGIQNNKDKIKDIGVIDEAIEAYLKLIEKES